MIGRADRKRKGQTDDRKRAREEPLDPKVRELKEKLERKGTSHIVGVEENRNRNGKGRNRNRQSVDPRLCDSGRRESVSPLQAAKSSVRFGSSYSIYGHGQPSNPPFVRDSPSFGADAVGAIAFCSTGPGSPRTEGSG